MHCKDHTYISSVFVKRWSVLSAIGLVCEDHRTFLLNHAHVGCKLGVPTYFRYLLSPSQASSLSSRSLHFVAIFQHLFARLRRIIHHILYPSVSSLHSPWHHRQSRVTIQATTYATATDTHRI
jgi:hypothetical protein